MQEEKNNHKYTAEYIRKYLDGELSDQAMQALEKAALDDPFLSDAIEGFEESRKHPVSFESGIAELQSRLSARTAERKTNKGIWIKLSGWPVAASVLVLLGIGIFMVIVLNKKPGISKVIPAQDTTTVAINTPSQENILKDNSTNPDEQRIVPGKPSQPAKISVGRKRDSSKRGAAKSISPENSANSVAAVPADDTADSLQKQEKSVAMVKKEISAPVAVAGAAPGRQEYSGAGLKSPGSAPGNYIKGMVIDQKGAPVPFADVILKGTNRHVFTDTAGFFKLYMKDPRLASLVFVQPAGYESVSAELTADSNVTNTIQVSPSIAVLEKNAVSKLASTPSITGWDAFYSYIDSNKKINSTDSLLRGEEVISFMLHPDGKLSSFRVEKSVSPTHDAAVLRLIQMAPALKSQEKKKQRCVLQIRF